jgi:cytochrome c oxidase subunit 3
MRRQPRSLPVRAHPLVFGVVIFLASELMFFAGLFAAYYDLRNRSGTWPPIGVRLNVAESSVGTALLFLSSIVMLLMTRALDRGRPKAAYGWLFTGIICGLSFITVALHGWSKNAFTIASSAYGSIFYAMTGFHLLHVVAGVILLTALYFGMTSNALQANRRAGAEAMMYYWHFVFIVWLGIWGTIYFVR